MKIVTLLITTILLFAYNNNVAQADERLYFYDDQLYADYLTGEYDRVYSGTPVLHKDFTGQLLSIPETNGPITGIIRVGAVHATSGYDPSTANFTLLVLKNGTTIGTTDFSIPEDSTYHTVSFSITISESITSADTLKFIVHVSGQLSDTRVMKVYADDPNRSYISIPAIIVEVTGDINGDYTIDLEDAILVCFLHNRNPQSCNQEFPTIAKWNSPILQ